MAIVSLRLIQITAEIPERREPVIEGLTRDLVAVDQLNDLIGIGRAFGLVAEIAVHMNAKRDLQKTDAAMRALVDDIIEAFKSEA